MEHDKKYRVIVVEDHKLFRTGLKMCLNKTGLVDIVAEASNGREFLDLLEEHKPDLVFMDIQMPVLDGIESAELALKINPGLKIIVLSAFADSEYIDKMLLTGVEGYMLKNSEYEDFKKAVEKVMTGGNYFSDEIIDNFTRSYYSKKHKEKEKETLPSFTQREKEVLELICKGYSNEEIGNKLYISNRTVERYKTNLIEKTGTPNTVNLVIYAFRNKLVS